MALDPWYVTGLCDGESTFNIAEKKDNRNGRKYSSFLPTFSIFMRADDGPLLKSIREFFGEGRLHYQDRSDRKYKASPMWAYQVSGYRACQVIMLHFNKYPMHGRKHKDFLVWREIVVTDRYAAPMTNERKMEIKIRLQEGRKFMAPSASAWCP